MCIFQDRERSYITGRKLKEVIFPTASAETEVTLLYRCIDLFPLVSKGGRSYDLLLLQQGKKI